MKAYLIIYPTDGSGAANIRIGMEKFRQVEHISDHSSVIITFYSEEDILDHLNKYNKDKAPIFVIHLPGGIHVTNVPADYFEPSSREY